MAKRDGFRDKRRVVTFELVHRSEADPLRGVDGVSDHVLRPSFRGADVSDERMQALVEAMAPEVPTRTQRAGIGADYNRFFGVSDDVKEDASVFFKCAEDRGEGSVFITPDGQVHDLEQEDVCVDRLAALFGSTNEDDAPPLVADTGGLLAAGVDPEIFVAMDDEDAEELPDDFVAQALALEAEEREDDEQFEASEETVSQAPTHTSHFSHRSAFLDVVEERTEALMTTVYKDGLVDRAIEEEEEEDMVDWQAVISDYREHSVDLASIGPPDPFPERLCPVEDEADATEDEVDVGSEAPPLDCRSAASSRTNMENRPARVEAAGRVRAARAPRKPVLETRERVTVTPSGGESREEVKARKRAVKEERRLRRREKKEMKGAFSRATQRVRKCIATTGAVRGQKVINL